MQEGKIFIWGALTDSWEKKESERKRNKWKTHPYICVSILYWCLSFWFRKMVMITLYARQKKRHRCIEQTFQLHGRRRGWDDLREQHRNMYIIICETDHQPRLDAWDKCLGLVHWDDPEGWDGEWGGREVQHGEHM